MPFEKRSLGKTDLTVSPFGIGGGYGIDEAALQAAADLGINFFFWSTWMLAYRRMERFLKNHLSNHRDETVIATAPYSWIFPGSVERSAEKHLRRLGIERIDLFILGAVMKENQERAVEELARVKERGLIRFAGFSCHNRAKILRMAQKYSLFDVLMLRYNAAHRGAESEIFDRLDGDNRPGIIAFNALKHGAMLKRPKGWPEDKPIPTAKQAYRFALSHPSVDACFAGVKTLDHVKELAEAAAEGPLSPDELAFLREFGDVRHG
jgi:aryl-alcohol dehydrogenase-like predicted oxidoreductase